MSEPGPVLLHVVTRHLTDPYFKQIPWSWRQIVDYLRDQPQGQGDRYTKVFERIDVMLRRAPAARSLLLAATLFHWSGFPKASAYENTGHRPYGVVEPVLFAPHPRDTINA